MGTPIRSRAFVGPGAAGAVGSDAIGRGRLSASGLQALTNFVDTAVPALLLLTLMAAEQNSETVPDLKRLATMLSEWQDLVGVDPEGPDPTPSAVSRLYRAVNSLKSQTGRIGDA